MWDIAKAVIAYPVTWLLATLIGGLAGIVGMPLARLGVMGFMNGLVGVWTCVAAFTVVALNPLWISLIVVVGLAFNDLRRAAYRASMDDFGTERRGVGAGFEVANAVGVIAGGYAGWAMSGWIYRLLA